METYNPLFGTPSPRPPLERRRYGFAIKNNRIQYANIFFDIEALDINYLPSDIEYLGQFPIYRDEDSRLILFRYQEKLLFHKRRAASDHQYLFPWKTIYWLVNFLEGLQHQHETVINFFDQKPIIEGHHLALISVAGDRPGTAGFWLRDYDTVDSTLVAMGYSEKSS